MKKSGKTIERIRQHLPENKEDIICKLSDAREEAQKYTKRRASLVLELSELVKRAQTMSSIAIRDKDRRMAVRV